MCTSLRDVMLTSWTIFVNPEAFWSMNLSRILLMYLLIEPLRIIYFFVNLYFNMVKYKRSTFSRACWEKFRDKDDLWYYMVFNLVSDAQHLTMQHNVLPKRGYTTLEHLQQIMQDEKSAIEASACADMKVPKYPELGVQKMWPVLKEIPGILRYIPDNWLERGMKRIDRKYVWKVVSFLDHRFVFDLIKDCKKQRERRKDGKIIERDDLQIVDAWKVKLAAVPYVASK